MPVGPCRSCKATNYPMSFGGADICPPCDSGMFGRINTPPIPTFGVVALADTRYTYVPESEVKTIPPPKDIVEPCAKCGAASGMEHDLEVHEWVARRAGAAVLMGLVQFASAINSFQAYLRLERLCGENFLIASEMPPEHMEIVLGDDFYHEEPDVELHDIPPECIETEQEAIQKLLNIESALGERLGLWGDVRAQLISLDLNNELVEDDLVANWHEYYSLYLQLQREATFEGRSIAANLADDEEPSDDEVASSILPAELTGSFWTDLRKRLATELFRQRIRTTVKVRKTVGSSESKMPTFTPPTWIYEGVHLWPLGARGEPIEGRTYELSRLRLRETAEDSTCIVTDLDAPEMISWADGDEPNPRKQVAVTVAYVMKSFVAKP